MVPVPVETLQTPFLDRRRTQPEGESPGRERRQFGNGYEELSPLARELAEAIDEYKLVHRRRFITCEELLLVIESIGYRK